MALLRSRNAHDRNVLVRRAHSRIDQAALEKETRNWKDARCAIIPSTPYDEGETIRMISARLVTKQERRIYEEGES
jgi:uncharacterized DUF497 family protein